MSVISQTYYLIIDWGISAPGHGKEVFYGFNDVVNTFLFLSNDINRLLCALVLAAYFFCYRQIKKNEILHAVDMKV